MSRLSRATAWLIVALRWPILLAWTAATIAGIVYLPSLEDAGAETSLVGLVPQDADSIEAGLRSTELFDVPVITHTHVVQRNPRGLSPAAARRVAIRARRIVERSDPELGEIRFALPLLNAERLVPGSAETGTTAITMLFFDPAETDLDDQDELTERYMEKYVRFRDDALVGRTGAVPARMEEWRQIEGGLPWVTLATVAVIALILGVHFRSPVAPVLTLFAAGIAYLISMRSVSYIGDRLEVTIPREAEPILVVLLLGVVTDYAVFFLHGMRERLGAGEARLDAARGATAEYLPIVVTAGLIVAGGTAALMAGELEFFKAFGPGMALTVLISLAVAVTFVPAAMAVLGPRVFSLRREAGRRATGGRDVAGLPPGSDPGARGSRVRSLRRSPIRRALGGRDDAVPATGSDPEAGASGGRTDAVRATGSDPGVRAGRGRAGRLAYFTTSRPVAFVIAAVAIVGLALACRGLLETNLGLTQIRGLPTDSEPFVALEAAEQGFAPGILSPTIVLLEGVDGRRDLPGLVRFQRALDDEPAVAGAIGPATPAATEIPRLVLSDDESAARFLLVLDRDPLGGPAIDAIGALRERLPGLLDDAGLEDATARLAGDTALAAETVETIKRDLVRIGIAAFVVNFLLLALFLRALVAPLYLVGASALALAASLGLTTLVFQGFLGHDELTYYVPFAVAVLLLSLGSDYNVFVVGRIWQHADSMPLREAIATAAPRASRAIGIAGLALALSFAALALIELRQFREFAFAMSVGVLLDAFVIRALLIPALISLVGGWSWWPRSRPALPEPEPDATVA